MAIQVKINNELIKCALEKVLSFEYGRMIMHDELAVWLEAPKGSRAFYTAMTKLKSLCLERGKMLASVRERGYRITDPDDYCKESIRLMKQGVNSVHRGKKVLDYAPTSEMSPIGLAEHREVSDKAQSFAAQIESGLIGIKRKQRSHPLLGVSV